MKSSCRVRNMLAWDQLMPLGGAYLDRTQVRCHLDRDSIGVGQFIKA